MANYPTPHINAKPGDFGKTVLMPGDPLRSKFIAENFLENAVLVNNVRGIHGYTGTYHGVKISVMASGMGMPSIGIYSWELYTVFGVENIMRIGSTGGNILSSDRFYGDDGDMTGGWIGNQAWKKMGVMAVEMEAAALYMNAARAGKRALAICTVSDHLLRNENCTAEERQNGFTNMMKLALETAVKLEK